MMTRGEENSSLLTRFIIDATGRRSTVARWLGARRHTAAPLFGAVFHASGGSGSNSAWIDVEAVQNGWWYASNGPRESRHAMFFAEAAAVKKFVRDWDSGNRTSDLPQRFNVADL